MSKKSINLICCLFLMVFICNSVLARASARPKACSSNIRLIQMAVEMYNIETTPMMENLDIKNLIKGHYLKEEPAKPETSCEYRNFGNLANGGFVFCKYHGDLENLLECEYYDEPFEKVSQNATLEEYNGSRERIRKLREDNKKRIAFKKTFNYYSQVTIIFIALITVIMTIFPSRKKAKK